MYIDSHAHFDIIIQESGIDETALLSNMKSSDVLRAIQISIDPEGFNWSLDFACRNKNNGIRFTAGIHPSSESSEHELDYLEKFIENIPDDKKNLLAGIGECGLDYYRMRRPEKEQHDSFIRQIAISKKFLLPIIIHSRDAFNDTISILKSENASCGVFHCFPGGIEEARIALDLGFFISFAGNVTYNKAFNLHESAAYVPSDRILVETDSPFLTPVPLRGKQNRPENIIHTYKYISELRKISLVSLEDSVLENFNKIFFN
jgi:TatD DNase family protein